MSGDELSDNGILEKVEADRPVLEEAPPAGVEVCHAVGADRNDDQDRCRLGRMQAQSQEHLRRNSKSWRTLHQGLG